MTLVPVFPGRVPFGHFGFQLGHLFGGQHLFDFGLGLFAHRLEARLRLAPDFFGFAIAPVEDRFDLRALRVMPVHAFGARAGARLRGVGASRGSLPFWVSSR